MNNKLKTVFYFAAVIAFTLTFFRAVSFGDTAATEVLINIVATVICVPAMLYIFQNYNPFK